MRYFGHIHGSALAGAALSALFACQPALAVDIPESGVLLSPQRIESENPLDDKPSRDYVGMPVGGWMLYPTMLVGGVYDDNVFQTKTNRKGAGGVRFRPSLIAEDNNGIHKTQVYGLGDIRIYPSYSQANVFEGRAGVAHVWQADRDLEVRIQGDYTRRQDPSSSGGANAFGVTTYSKPQTSNAFTGTASVQKNFNAFFVGLGGSVSRLIYDSSNTGNPAYTNSLLLLSGVSPLAIQQTPSRNGTASSVTGRIGMFLTPAIYGFVDSTGNIRRYDAGLWNSDGYRFVAGLGTSNLGLVKGEIYAGYQKQFYVRSDLFRNPSSPVFGGRVFWYPTRDMTFMASVDETINDNTQTTLTSASGGSSKTLATQLRGDYALSRLLSAFARFGLSSSVYSASARRDYLYQAGTGLSYNVLRNLDVTFDYSYSRLVSNATNASYVRNVITAGATYRY